LVLGIGGVDGTGDDGGELERETRRRGVREQGITQEIVGLVVGDVEAMVVAVVVEVGDKSREVERAGIPES
jgi:hypothetical protein